MQHNRRTILFLTIPILVELGITVLPNVIDIPHVIWVWLLVIIGITIVILPMWSEWATVKRIRPKNPFYLKAIEEKQSLLGKEGNSFQKPAKKKPNQLEYDNVLWEEGRDGWGGIRVIGPLCPIDSTPLCTEHYDKIKTNPMDDVLISDSEYNSRLFCIKCESKYTLGKQGKTISDSRSEVHILFEGGKRREQQRG